MDKAVSADFAEWQELFSTLPGGELIRKGLEDLDHETMSVEALLVLVGAPRLENLGLRVRKTGQSPEDLLYDTLAQQDPDSAHSRYNALIRVLVSFERAAECVKK